MKNDAICITEFQCFTKQEVIKDFRNFISVKNLDILLAHISHPELSRYIEGFIEQNGTLFFLIDGEMVSATHNLSHPTFSN